jgi:hypothetical protein
MPSPTQMDMKGPQCLVAPKQKTPAFLQRCAQGAGV